MSGFWGQVVGMLKQLHPFLCASYEKSVFPSNGVSYFFFEVVFFEVVDFLPALM